MLRADFTDFHRTIQRLAPMSPAAFALAEPHLSVRELRKGEHLLHAGELATTVAFVRRGLLREYYLDDDGVQATRTFCPEGEVSGSLADLLSGAPAMVFIQALETSTLVELPWNALVALADQSPQWERVCRRHAEQLVLRKVKREHEMLTLKAADRHARFVTERPGLDARLTREVVASYLGITPVHLSRIRAASRRRRAPAAPPRRR
jgi:CRP-like cAMP-binding protein